MLEVLQPAHAYDVECDGVASSGVACHMIYTLTSAKSRLYKVANVVGSAATEQPTAACCFPSTSLWSLRRSGIYLLVLSLSCALWRVIFAVTGAHSTLLGSAVILQVCIYSAGIHLHHQVFK